MQRIRLTAAIALTLLAVMRLDSFAKGNLDDVLGLQTSVSFTEGSWSKAIRSLANAVGIPIVAPVIEQTPTQSFSLRFQDTPVWKILDAISRQTGCQWLQVGKLVIFQKPLPVMLSSERYPADEELDRYLISGGFRWDPQLVADFVNSMGSDALCDMRDGIEIKRRDLPPEAQDALLALLQAGEEIRVEKGPKPIENDTIGLREITYNWLARYCQCVRRYEEIRTGSMPHNLLNSFVESPHDSDLSVGFIAKRITEVTGVRVTVDPRIADLRVVITAPKMAASSILHAVALAMGKRVILIKGIMHLGMGGPDFIEPSAAVKRGRQSKSFVRRQIYLFDAAELTSCVRSNGTWIPDGWVFYLRHGGDVFQEWLFMRLQRPRMNLAQ